MIKNAKQEREARAQEATERKGTMKEMMARARAEREAAAEGKKSELADKLIDGQYRNEGEVDRSFFDGVAEKAE